MLIAELHNDRLNSTMIENDGQKYAIEIQLKQFQIGF